jgi:FkbM family methyltransferase
MSATPPTLIAANRYGRYCVPSSSAHRPAAQAVLAGGVWEPQTLELIAANCGERDVVHAGAYFGDFLPALSAAVAPDTFVWAFEPNPENHVCASQTLALNGLTNVRLFHAGLGAENASLPFAAVDKEGRALGGGSSFNLAANPATRLRSDIRTLDGIVGERPVGVIQLDVEGFEEQALTGAVATIARCLPLIILEGVPAASSPIMERLAALGYKRAGVVHQNTVLAQAPAAVRWPVPTAPSSR